MRSRGRLVIALVMVVAVASFSASCANKVVRTQTQTPPASTTKPEVPKAEVPKAEVRKSEGDKMPVVSGEKAAQAGRPEDDRARAEAAAREAAQWVFVNEHIHFAYDSSLLSDQARQILHGKAEYLRTNPGIAVTVEGHCDDRGTIAYNLALGDRRAESVKSYLAGLGIGANRLNTVSYGKERPVAAGHDESSWARNRRAQLVIN